MCWQLQFRACDIFKLEIFLAKAATFFKGWIVTHNKQVKKTDNNFLTFCFCFVLLVLFLWREGYNSNGPMYIVPNAFVVS